jgi:hypothetical protein
VTAPQEQRGHGEEHGGSRRRSHLRTAIQEAFVLPLLFLTIALAGGFRLTPAGEMRFLRPSLFSLVLAALLLGALVQSRLLRPAVLIANRSTTLESVSGLVLLLSLFAATTQLLGGLVPEKGLLGLLFNLFLAVLLTTMMAAEPDERRLVRSLAVVFAWALLMKYVLLPGLEVTDGTWTARLVRSFVQGATLGALPVEAWSPAVGYVMFASAAVYLIGIWLLSRDRVLSPP